MEEQQKNRGCGCVIALVAVLVVTLVILLVLLLVVIKTDVPATPQTPLPVQGGVPSHAQVDGVREYYTDIHGDGTDTVTVLLYMIGSDLESRDGAATDDLMEILAADLGDNVRVVMQTGGCKDWHNNVMTDGATQRFTFINGDLRSDDSLPGRARLNMVDPATLTDFITWGTTTYPANRYQLILWDHGGGTMAGFGSDEYYEDEALELSEIATALRDSGTKFDFVGFDACLMGTVEMAYALEPYADYFIASEESEPSAGWSYTHWLTELGKNPSMDTISLGQLIIDDYVQSQVGYGRLASATTLSIAELREMPLVQAALQNYFSGCETLLQDKQYNLLAAARADVKSYGEGDFEQVDIVDYIRCAPSTGEAGEALKATVESAVKYHSGTAENSCGLSMYSPYTYPDYYTYVRDELKKLGLRQCYDAYYDDFVSVMLYGQNQVPTQTLAGVLTGNEQDSEEDTDSSAAPEDDWYNEETGAALYDGGYNLNEWNDLVLDDKGDYYALHLTDDQWAQIVSIEMIVFDDTGDGYIELGKDNLYSFDEAGDLICDYDYTWVALNGQVVPFYAESEWEKEDGTWYTGGTVPVTLNGDTDVDLAVYWSNEMPEGAIAGYHLPPTGDAPATQGKGETQLKEGDVLEPYCSFYTPDGDYEADYYFGDPITYTEKGGIEISYQPIGDDPTEVCFALTDIYNNTFYTEVIRFE